MQGFRVPSVRLLQPRARSAARRGELETLALIPVEGKPVTGEAVGEDLLLLDDTFADESGGEEECVYIVVKVYTRLDDDNYYRGEYREKV